MTRQSKMKQIWAILMGTQKKLERTVSTIVDNNPEGAVAVVNMSGGGPSQNQFESFGRGVMNAIPAENRGELGMQLINEIRAERKHKRNMITRQNIFNKHQSARNKAAAINARKAYMQSVKSVLKWAVMFGVLYASFTLLAKAVSVDGVIDTVNKQLEKLGSMSNEQSKQNHSWYNMTAWFKKGTTEGMSFLLQLTNIFMIFLGAILETGINIATALSLICTSVLLVVRVATQNRSISWLGIHNTGAARIAAPPTPVGPPVTIQNMTQQGRLGAPPTRRRRRRRTQHRLGAPPQYPRLRAPSSSNN